MKMQQMTNIIPNNEKIKVFNKLKAKIKLKKDIKTCIIAIILCL